VKFDRQEIGMNEIGTAKSIRVFISYARKDFHAARRIYDELKSRGFKPWMDKVDLLPGMTWRDEIKRSIDESHFFLALLSPHALSERGYVQKELKSGLEILDTFPRGKIYFIPARLAECHPEDEKLKDLQWADLFPDSAFEDGMASIVQAMSKGRAIPASSISSPNFPNINQPGINSAELFSIPANSNPILSPNQTESAIQDLPDPFAGDPPADNSHLGEAVDEGSSEKRTDSSQKAEEENGSKQEAAVLPSLLEIETESKLKKGTLTDDTGSSGVEADQFSSSHPDSKQKTKLSEKVPFFQKRKKTIAISIFSVFTIILILGIAFYLVKPKSAAPPQSPINTTLVIQTDPFGAMVFVNGKKFGPSPQRLNNLTPGRTLSIRAEQNGFEDSEQNFVVPASDESTVLLSLPISTKPAQPSPGQIANGPLPGMKFAYIPPGEFMMGSPEDEPGRHNDEGLHKVVLTQGFWLQTTETTQMQWEALMESNPSFNKCGANCPVEQVSWKDVQEFLRRLNKRGEGEYRLPTEAEWEYAARAGTTTPFYFGDCLSTDQANYDGNHPLTGCPKGQYRERILEVESLNAPNLWNLHDMHGNVWEWCKDWYRPYPIGTVFDPLKKSSGEDRIIRGGGGGSDAMYCRSANRGRKTPSGSFNFLGFRVLSVHRPGKVR
jgi:formylglycine-generating enzyme required for sulfatase activity